MRVSMLIFTGREAGLFQMAICPDTGLYKDKKVVDLAVIL